MKKLFPIVMAAMLILNTVLFFSAATPAGAKEAKILEFDTMVGVPRPYTGSTNAIRGIPGGGLPWVIADAKGELKASGKLEIKVTGLVFDPNDPAVIERGIGGTNTVPNFKAVVSCLSKDMNGNPITVNVATDQFPANTAGNAKVETVVNLPSPCIAPIIFITNPAGAWFASTGF